MFRTATWSKSAGERMHIALVIAQLPLVIVTAAVFYLPCCFLALAKVASWWVKGQLAHGIFGSKMRRFSSKMEMFWWGNTYDYLWIPIWRFFGGGKRVLYVHYDRLDQKQSTAPDKPEDCVRFVFISDTHNKHDHMRVPHGDVLVHTGDILMLNSRLCLLGPRYDLHRFSGWFRRQPHTHKIVMGGNHDTRLMDMGKDACAALFKGATYLENSSVIVEGFKIWGCPWSPNSGSPNRGFVLPNDEAEQVMRDIPTDVHILLTHALEGAPFVGQCVRRIAPLVHAGGHFHAMHGIDTESFTWLALCASICDTLYRPIQSPIVLDLPRRLATAK